MGGWIFFCDPLASSFLFSLEKRGAGRLAAASLVPEVAYGLMGAFLLFCACGAAYIHWASRRKRTDAQQQGGWSQA